MSGCNLVVYKNGKIAFSDYFVKSNRSLLKTPLEKYVRLTSSNLFIPLDSMALSRFDMDTNKRGGDKLPDSIIYSIELMYTGDILQTSRLGGVTDMFSIKGGEDSWFARAGEWRLETSAATGCIIYDDVGKIYEEAFHVSGTTAPPYYIGDVDKISRALKMIPILVRSTVLVMANKRARPNLKDPGKLIDIYDKDPDQYDKDVKSISNDPVKLSKLRKAVIDAMGLKRRNDFF